MGTKKPQPFNIETRISNKIRALAKESGINARKLGQKIGLENIYRILNGERHWSFKYLLAISEVFGVPVEHLVGEAIEVPIVALFSALTPPDYPEVIVARQGIVELQGGGAVGERIQRLYAFELADRSMMPVLKPGTKFIAEKDSSALIKHEDLVVCPDDTGKAHVCRIQFTGDHHITLKSLNPTVPDLVLPRNRIHSCDLIIDIRLK
jgi:transcriptional regulator with XRE-family HTH domain